MARPITFFGPIRVGEVAGRDLRKGVGEEEDRRELADLYGRERQVLLDVR
jgi:hypothetical protein